MTENEKRKEGDDLMTCFVIHVSLLSLHIFLEIAVLQKMLVVYHPLTNLSRRRMFVLTSFVLFCIVL